MSAANGPLSGVRVIDFTANMAGPFATQILADQGADVIKVEPPEGDVSRQIGNGTEDYSAFFANLNRGKRSLMLDLADDGASAVVARLLDHADIVIHSYRPASAQRHGLDADTVRAARPHVIHTTITGFGSAGPYGGRPAYDHVIQAAAGFAAAQADPDTGEPQLIKQGLVDKLVGQTAAQAMTAALFQRVRTNTGSTLDIRMLSAAIAFIWPDTMMNHTALEPAIRRPSIARSFRLTTTADGYLAFALATSRQYARLAQAIGAADIVDQRAVLKLTAQHLAQLPTSDAVDLLARFEIPVSPVMTLDTVHEHPQTRFLDTIDELQHPVLGRTRQPRPSVIFEHANTTMRPAPRLGEHTAAIITELRVGQPGAHAGSTRADSQNNAHR